MGPVRDTSSVAPGGPPTEEQIADIRARLVKAVGRVCPPWLSAQADDLVQVALLRVLDARKGGEGIAGLSSSYLSKAAYSAVVDEIRQHRRRKEVSADEEDGMTVPAVANPSPEAAAAARRLGEGMRECMTHLVRPRRLAVTLYLQGHTVPEAGRLLGWTTKKTENLVYRALADLRRCLTAKGMTP